MEDPAQEARDRANTVMSPGHESGPNLQLSNGDELLCSACMMQHNEADRSRYGTEVRSSVPGVAHYDPDATTIKASAPSTGSQLVTVDKDAQNKHMTWKALLSHDLCSIPDLFCNSLEDLLQYLSMDARMSKTR
jgi:hypothetical protein